MKPMNIACIGIALGPFLISALLRTVGGYDVVQCLLLWIGLTSALGFSFCLIAITDFSQRLIKISEAQQDEIQKIRECVVSVASKNRDFSN